VFIQRLAQRYRCSTAQCSTLQCQYGHGTVQCCLSAPVWQALTSERGRSALEAMGRVHPPIAGRPRPHPNYGQQRATHMDCTIVSSKSTGVVCLVLCCTVRLETAAAAATADCDPADCDCDCDCRLRLLTATDCGCGGVTVTGCDCG